MKTVLAALALSAALTGVARASEAPTLDVGVYSGEHVDLLDAAWIGRYGQVCVHGPIWLRACHATNRPGAWIPGHWNPMRTRFVPGHYA